MQSEGVEVRKTSRPPGGPPAGSPGQEDFRSSRTARWKSAGAVEQQEYRRQRKNLLHRAGEIVDDLLEYQWNRNIGHLGPDQAGKARTTRSR